MATVNPRLRALIALTVFLAGLLAATPFGVTAAVHDVTAGGAPAAPAMRVGGPDGLAVAPQAANSCEYDCTRRGREVYRACIKAGLGVSECVAREYRTRMECIQRNCSARPTVLTCEGQCEQAGKAYREGCLATGGRPADCDRRMKAYIANCIAAQCQAKSLTCNDLCRQRADDAYANCLSGGGTVEQCSQQRQAVLEICLRNCAPITVSCAATCNVKAQQAYDSCIANGGTPTACQDAANAARMECLSACARATPVASAVPTATCQQNCEVRARELLEACLKAGGNPDDCAAQAKAALETCLTSCTSIVRPTAVATPTCEQNCQQRARELLEACLKAGGGQDECAAQAKAALEECLRGCTSDPNPTRTPTPTCAQGCEQRARDALQACLNAGISPDVCAARAKAVLDECLIGCGTVVPPPTATPATCAERCAMRAREALAACLSAGGSPDECAVKARAVLEECLLLCEPTPTPTPLPIATPTCPQQCEAKAEAARQACLDDGRPADECDQLAATTLQECLTSCLPAGNLECVARCQLLGRQVYDECISAGGSQDVCTAKQQQAVADCIAANCRH